MIYLDAAATSFQKPDDVWQAVQTAARDMSSPGRGGYPAAIRAADTVFQCRQALSDFFHADNPERIVFTLNATHALNIAIKSLVHPGSRVVISGYEHSAVTRPLAAIGNVRTIVAESPLFQPQAALDAFAQAITPGTDAVICTHVSNVFGTVLPIRQIAELCRERKVPLIIDASQSAGILPLDVSELQPAFVAMPGHKGLYGPQGTGVLICSETIPSQTLIEGGTGSLPLQQSMPDFLPDRLEAGTHNVPGIAGLLEGVRFVSRLGIDQIRESERALALAAANGLRRLPGIEVFATPDLSAQCGVVSFRLPGKDVEELGEVLSQQDIAVRTGYHCAPLAHRTAGTLKTGTIRVSFSAFNTPEDVVALLTAVGQSLL